MDDKKLLGRKIQEIRKSRGLTQEMLAEIVEMEPNSISIIESGRNFPTLSNLVKIANALGVGLSDFFTYDYLNSAEELKKIILEKIETMDEKGLKNLFKYIKMLY